MSFLGFESSTFTRKNIYFEDAISQSYGYLLVDLKPTTPEGLHMRTDIFRIKEANDHDNNHFMENNQV
jgi:hypothetical protein